jgi:Tfp pilus assembly protein PilO
VNEKKITIITIVCLVFILLAGGGAIYYLQFVKLVELEDRLKLVRKELNETRAKVAQIPKLKEEIKALEIEEKDKMRRIPSLDRAEYDALANMLDEFRRRSGVNVARGAWVVPQKPQPVAGRPPPRMVPPTVHKVQYEMTVSGGFYQLLRYVNLIEQQTRFINVESFSVSKASDTATGASPRRDMKVILYSYTYRPPADTVEIEIEEQRKGRSTEIPD